MNTEGEMHNRKLRDKFIRAGARYFGKEWLETSIQSGDGSKRSFQSEGLVSSAQDLGLNRDSLLRLKTFPDRLYVRLAGGSC
jgi:hypothetical protein